jgi:hypothetical protein
MLGHMSGGESKINKEKVRSLNLSVVVLKEQLRQALYMSLEILYMSLYSTTVYSRLVFVKEASTIARSRSSAALIFFLLIYSSL